MITLFLYLIDDRDFGYYIFWALGVLIILSLEFKLITTLLKWCRWGKKEKKEEGQ